MNTNQITHKHWLYHVTDAENVANILKEGLKNNGMAVYLSEDPFSWWKPGMVILKVRATGLKDKMTRVDEKLDEILVWDDIRPERIKVYKLYGKKLKDAEDRYYFHHPKEGYKYHFAINGKIEFTKNFQSDTEAFDHRCELERKTKENWKVYNDRGDMIYGVAIMR